MRLSELLAHPDFKKARIVVLGKWKTTDGSFVVIGFSGKPITPITSLQHPIQMLSEDDVDPEIDNAEIQSIRRRFGLPQASIKFPRLRFLCALRASSVPSALNPLTWFVLTKERISAVPFLPSPTIFPHSLLLNCQFPQSLPFSYSENYSRYADRHSQLESVPPTSLRLPRLRLGQTALQLIGSFPGVST